MAPPSGTQGTAALPWVAAQPAQDGFPSDDPVARMALGLPHRNSRIFFMEQIPEHFPCASHCSGGWERARTRKAPASTGPHSRGDGAQASAMGEQLSGSSCSQVAVGGAQA